MRSLITLNSKLSFSYTACYTKFKEPRLLVGFTFFFKGIRAILNTNSFAQV